ncbi:MAG: DinB family protein [Rhodothermales bacterium]
MPHRHTANTLVATVDTAAAHLIQLDDATVRIRPAPEKWSIAEILGHLLDSAVNNHHRFIRAQQDDPLVFPRYEQDFWVEAQDFPGRPWGELVALWRLYNHHLAHVMRRVPADRLGVECRIGPYEPVTLGYLIEDYLTHLEHHLRQIEALAS